MNNLTTQEVAALLIERGYAKGTHRNQPLTADAVKRMCYKGKFPHAELVRRGPGRGYWLIPLEDVEAFLSLQQPSNQPAPSG